MTPEEFEFELIAANQYIKRREGQPYLKSYKDNWQKDAADSLLKAAEEAIAKKKLEESNVEVVDAEEVFERIE